jgi:hypothetical protein
MSRALHAPSTLRIVVLQAYDVIFAAMAFALFRTSA